MAAGSAPTRSAKSRKATPDHVCVVDHPSTQAIGSLAVCWPMASKAFRLRLISSEPERTISRHDGPTRCGSCSASELMRYLRFFSSIQVGACRTCLEDGNVVEYQCDEW